MIMEYCELLHQNSLRLLEIQEWLIDVNLAIIILTLKRIVTITCN